MIGDMLLHQHMLFASFSLRIKCSCPTMDSNQYFPRDVSVSTSNHVFAYVIWNIKRMAIFFFFFFFGCFELSDWSLGTDLRKIVKEIPNLLYRGQFSYKIFNCANIDLTILTICNLVSNISIVPI